MKNVKEFDEYRKFYRNLKENEIEEMDIILVKKMMSYVDVILNHLYARDESRDLLSIEEVKFFIEKMQKSIIKNDRIELKNCVDVVECQIQDASKLVSFDYFHNRILLYIFSIISFLNLGESDDFTKALSEHISNIQFEKQTLLELKKIIRIMKKSQNYNLLLEIFRNFILLCFIQKNRRMISDIEAEKNRRNFDLFSNLPDIESDQIKEHIKKSIQILKKGF